MVIATFILAMVAFWAIGSTIHNHPIYTVEDNCPGCQLERTPGCDTLALLAVLVPPLLVALYLLVSDVRLPVTRLLDFLPRCFRSPPAAC